MEETDKATSLLQACPDPKAQLEQERVESEAAAAISARRAFACRVVAVGITVLFVVLFCFKAVGESADQKREYSSSCMHALGGGITGPRGDLLHFDPHCTDELKDYFDQAYYAEVRRVSDQAIQYFRQQIARHQLHEFPNGSRGIVIFDIDETALSNMDGFFGGSSWSRLFGRTAATRCVRPHLEYSALEPLRLKVVAARSGGGDLDGADLADPDAAAADISSTMTLLEPGLPPSARRPLCSSPPLRATLDLYNFLYDNNFTVVFLTGRSEDGRSETEANLAVAGYGRKCGADRAATSASASASTLASAAATDPHGSARRAGSHHRRRQLLQESAGIATSATGSGSGAAAAPFGGLFSPPAAPPQRCYAELVMREVGDERLASVFKAEARSRLVAGGHVLVGNIGDQFSDLVGQAAAPANFKLPNPVYTLL